MTFEIGPELEARLQAQAHEQGIEIEELIDAVLDIAANQSAEIMAEAIEKLQEWRGNAERAAAETQRQVLRYSEAKVLFKKAKRGEQVALGLVLELIKRNKPEPENLPNN